MPLDPFSKRPFFYKISAGEEVEGWDRQTGQMKIEKLLPGQGVIWIDFGANDFWYFPVPLGSEREEEP
jgi:hypothetical protein